MNQYELNFEFWAGKRVCIIGGTGTLGTQIIKELSQWNIPIRVFSRDEYKQNTMKREFKNVDFFQGDICKKDSLEEGILGYDVIINAAANKDLVSCEDNPSNALDTNVIGNRNLMHLMLRTPEKKLLYCSSDKAEDPVSFYGCSKLMGEYFAKRVKDHRITRAGNYWASRRSNIEHWDALYLKGEELIVHDPAMTRFYISTERVARFNLWTLEQQPGIYYPEMLSVSNEEIIKKRYPKAKIKIIGAQPGEKIHELVNGVSSNSSQYLASYETMMESL